MKQFLNKDLSKNFFDFHIFSSFLVFNHDFTQITASNTASDDVKN